MYSPEQVKTALSVVESQRAAAVETAIHLAMRVTELERMLKEAQTELAAYRPMPAPPPTA